MRTVGWAAAASVLLLGGCGHRDDAAGGSGDEAVLKAPVANQAAIAHFVPPVAPSPTPTGRAAAAALLPDAAGAGDAANGSAAAAQELATRYFTLIGQRRYGEAWGLWRDHGKASMKTPAAFAQEFRHYARYAATIGAPRSTGGGAREHFIVVPVRIAAIDRAGHAEALAGTLTLYRIPAAIGTGDPAQHLWRINGAQIRPANEAPGAAAAAAIPAHTEARYRCDDGFAFRAAFDNVADRATLSDGARTLATLAGQRPASGIWYAGGGWSLRGKGREATLTRPGAPDITCRAG